MLRNVLAAVFNDALLISTIQLKSFRSGTNQPFKSRSRVTLYPFADLIQEKIGARSPPVWPRFLGLLLLLFEIRRNGDVGVRHGRTDGNQFLSGGHDGARIARRGVLFLLIAGDSFRSQTSQ